MGSVPVWCLFALADEPDADIVWHQVGWQCFYQTVDAGTHDIAHHQNIDGFLYGRGGQGKNATAVYFKRRQCRPDQSYGAHQRQFKSSLPGLIIKLPKESRCRATGIDDQSIGMKTLF